MSDKVDLSVRSTRDSGGASNPISSGEPSMLADDLGAREYEHSPTASFSTNANQAFATYSTSPQAIPRMHIRRRSSVTLQALPPQIRLPFIDRPEELESLREFNSTFFTLLEHSVGSYVYNQQLLPLLKSSRNDIDDTTFLNAIKRILCFDGECSSRMWAEFCRIVGCDDATSTIIDHSSTQSEYSNPSTPPTPYRENSPPLFRTSNLFGSVRRKSSDVPSNAPVSPDICFSDPILEED